MPSGDLLLSAIVAGEHNLLLASEVDEELSAKLASEIAFEQDVKGDPLPPSIKDFLDNSPFELQDIAGKEEVVLTRNYGNEK